MSIVTYPTPYRGVSVAAATQPCESRAISTILNAPEAPVSLQARRWQRALSETGKMSIDELTFDDLLGLQESGVIGPADIKDLLGDEWFESLRIMGSNLQQRFAEIIPEIERIVADISAGLPHFDGIISISGPIHSWEEPSARIEQDIDMDTVELTRLVRDSVAGEIATLRADVRGVSDGQIRLEEAVTNTSKSLDRLSGSLDNAVGELRAMTTAVAVQQSEIGHLQEASTEHGADLREQEQSITRITTTIAVVGSIIAVVLIPVAIAAVQYILS